MKAIKKACSGTSLYPKKSSVSSKLKTGGKINKAQSGTKAKPRKMSEAQLSALAHQKRGMGPVDSRYVKKSGPIMNELGTLNPDQVKQLKNYMNKSSTAEKIYQALPNVGRIFGSSAADVPSRKTGGVIKKKTTPKAKDGKWIQKAVNPKHKGYCTPMTKATCTPKRKALAKTFKKMAKERKGK
jgi:hypothetical protein